MEVVDICDLCGSRNQKPFEVYERYEQTFTLVECLRCGLAYLNPCPTNAEIGHYYDEAYSNIHGIYRPPSLQAFLIPVLRCILRVRYSDNSGWSFLVRCLFLPWELKWRNILRSAHFENIDHIGRILDVGCGKGYFLSTMRRWGFECYGCEPDSQAAHVAQEEGLLVKCSDLLNAGYADSQFDIVRFSHVLEHVHQPTLVLSEAQRVLRPGGLIVVEVPNHAGIVGQAFHHSEDVPRHLYGFSPDTLRRYYEKVGLRVVRITTGTVDAYPIYSQLKRYAFEMARVDGLFSGRESEIEKFWSFQNHKRHSEYIATARFFDSIGRGSSVVAIGTKD